MADGRLKEVEEDAIYIQTRRFAEQEQERQHNIEKAKTKVSKPVVESEEKGK